MKILLLITSLGMGGAEKVVTALADALVSKGHEVLIVYLTGEAVVLPANASIKIINLDMVSRMDAVSAFLKLKRLIQEFQPDVVHSHMLHSNILARIVRVVTPISRLISTVHSSNEGGMLCMLAYRMTDALADISTNVSKEAVESFIKAKATKPGRIIAVHNGISNSVYSFNTDIRERLRRALQVDENCQLILAVGRLVKEKDYPNLLNAMAHISDNGIHCMLCIVGEGPLRGGLEALAIELGLADRVQFLGTRHDVADIMCAADVFVLSSASEGFGLVVAEAMACERVVVATDCGGVREVVGKAGYLVKPKDAKALAGALAKALQLTTLQRASLGRDARMRVTDKFSLDAMVESWLRIYV